MNNTSIALIIIIPVIWGLIFWVRRNKTLSAVTQKKSLLVAKIVTTVLIIVQFFLMIHFPRNPSPSSENGLSQDEIDNIKTSISKCWDISEKDSNLPIVKIYVLLNPDTSIQNIHVVDAEKERYANDTVYKKTADRAMKDLKTCNPLTFLPKGKYEIWKELVLTFNPKPDQ